MQLLKIFDLKGLWENGRRFDAPLGTFQKIKNAFVDKTGRVQPIAFGNRADTPSGNGGILLNGYTNSSVDTFPFFLMAVPFLNKLFSVVFCYDSASPTYGNIGFKYSNLSDGDGSYIPDTGKENIKIITLNYYFEKMQSGNFSSTILYDKLYFNISTDDLSLSGYKRNLEYGLITFDGFKIREAGLPTPWAHVDDSGVVGNHYVRQVYITMGFDGELICSAFRQDKVASATINYRVGRFTALSVEYINYIGKTGCYPKKIARGDSLYYGDSYLLNGQLEGSGSGGNQIKVFDKSYIGINLLNASHSNGELTIEKAFASSDFTDIANGRGVGKWLMIYPSFLVGDPTFPGTIGGSLLAFQVKSYTTGAGSTVTFEKMIKVFSNTSPNWEDYDLSEYLTGSLTVGEFNQFVGQLYQGVAFTNIFNVLSYSTSETSGFETKVIAPVCFNHGLEIAINMATTNLNEELAFGRIIPTMLDWYDDKKSFARFPSLNGVTEYLGMIVGHDAFGVYRSSTALGGSSEMIDGDSNFTIPNVEAGIVTAVCGSEEFLYVARESKNFIIRGDLSGGVPSIIDCDYPTQGAISSRACINSFGGEVIFINKSGVYSVNSSGIIREISKNIRNLFTGENLIDDHDFKGNLIRSIRNVVDNGRDGTFINMSIDSVRSLLIITFGLYPESPLNIPTVEDTDELPPSTLIYSFYSEEWFEYKGSVPFNMLLSSNGQFIRLGKGQWNEDQSQAMTGEDDQTLKSSWITTGEPSLEKQIGQLRLYGEEQGIELDHTLHLDYGQRQSLPANILINVDDYDSKKRMNAEKTRAFSFELVGKYKLDGIEIEITPLQNGVKK